MVMNTPNGSLKLNQVIVCRACVLDQVDFSRLLGVCAHREDVVRIDADVLLLKTQEFSIRLVGSRFESRDKSEHVAVKLESLIDVRHRDANVQEFFD